MTTVGTYRCPEPSCLRPLVRLRKRGSGWYLWCQACRTSLPIPEREKLKEIGASFLPGFEENS